MTPLRWALLFALVSATSSLPAQCINDHRENKNGGILVTDFTITGTQNISATDLARITSNMIGSCYNEDSDEIEQRVRISFQNRGAPGCRSDTRRVEIPNQKRPLRRAQQSTEIDLGRDGRLRRFPQAKPA